MFISSCASPSVNIKVNFKSYCLTTLLCCFPILPFPQPLSSQGWNRLQPWACLAMEVYSTPELSPAQRGSSLTCLFFGIAHCFHLWCCQYVCRHTFSLWNHGLCPELTVVPQHRWKHAKAASGGGGSIAPSENQPCSWAVKRAAVLVGSCFRSWDSSSACADALHQNGLLLVPKSCRTVSTLSRTHIVWKFELVETKWAPHFKEKHLLKKIMSGSERWSRC